MGGIAAHGLAQGGQIHVVEQDHARPGGKRLVELGQRFDLDLHEACCGLAWLDGLLRLAQCQRHAPGGGNVVFFDQHRVVQTQAVVAATAHAHRVFLRQPQARQGFAGVHDLRPRACHALHVARGLGGHGAQGLQKVERGALGAQQGARLAFDAQHHLVGGAALALGHQPVQLRLGVERLHGRLHPRRAAKHGGLARQQVGVGAALGGDQGGA